MSMNSTAIPDNIASIAGPQLLGYLLNWWMFGILSTQVYWYYLAFPKDKWHAKSLVAFIYAIETAQAIIMANDCWNTYAKGFGDIDVLNNAETEWLAAPMLTAIVSFAVQTFYAYRLYLLSNGCYSTWVIAAFSVVQLAGGLASGIQAVQYKLWSLIDEHAHVNEGLWLGATVLVDVLIAGRMVLLLTSKKQFTAATRTMVNKLIRMIIETGAFTAIVAVLALVLFYKFPDVPLHACTFNILAKAYSLSAMAIFNSRIRILGGRDSRDEASELQISLRGRSGSGSESGMTHSTGDKPGVVHIRSDVHVHSESTEKMQV